MGFEGKLLDIFCWYEGPRIASTFNEVSCTCWLQSDLFPKRNNAPYTAGLDSKVSLSLLAP